MKAYVIVVEKFLFDHFHCVDLLRFFVFNLQHFCVAASANHPQQIEIVHRNRERLRCRL